MKRVPRGGVLLMNPEGFDGQKAITLPNPNHPCP